MDSRLYDALLESNVCYAVVVSLFCSIITVVDDDAARSRSYLYGCSRCTSASCSATGRGEGETRGVLRPRDRRKSRLFLYRRAACVYIQSYIYIRIIFSNTNYIHPRGGRGIPSRAYYILLNRDRVGGKRNGRRHKSNCTSLILEMLNVI